MHLKIARILLVVASLFPISVGVYYYIYFALSGSFRYMEHIAFTNLITSGVVGLVLSHCGLRHAPKPWVLFLIFFNLYWTLGNDTYATVRLYALTKGSFIFPIPVIPLALGTIASILTIVGLKNE